MRKSLNNHLEYSQRQQGFTLVEVAVVLVIIGILIGSFVGSFSDRIETTRRDNTKKQLAEIRSSLLGFASTWGRIPCPASASSDGDEAVFGTSCIMPNGFVPGKILGLNGPYNLDGLLIDSWSNPIRFSVTEQNSNAFTRAGEMRNVTMALLTPDLTICRSFTTGATPCPTTDILTDTAPFVILSLGKDGHEFINTASADSDQGENSSEVVASANATGENIAYTVAGDTVFVSTGYSSVDSTAGQFDDLIIWVSPYILYDRMIEAGQLP